MTSVQRACDHPPVPRWNLPLTKAFGRAITPDKPTTANTTTLIGDLFVQVSRAFKRGVTGPEAFTLLMRLLTKHFDRADTGEGPTKLYNLECTLGRLFAISVGSFPCQCRQLRGASAFCPLG